MSAPTLLPAAEVAIRGRGRVLVYDSGPGPRSTVLLLHGWTSTAALNFHRVMLPLASRHRVVALDQRGHGRGIRSRVPFRLEDCADDAAALVDQIGVGPVTVVGYSMGGPVALLMWRRQRAAVAGLVLCATAPYFARRPPLGPLGLGASMALSLVPPAVRRSGMAYATSRWQAANGSAGWAVEEWSRHDPSALVQAGMALSRFDARPWLDSVDVPTSVVVTETDSVVPPSRQRLLVERVPGAAAFPVAGDHRVVVDSLPAFLAGLLPAVDAVQNVSRCPAR